jgi:hypothetical protein
MQARPPGDCTTLVRQPNKSHIPLFDQSLGSLSDTRHVWSCRGLLIDYSLDQVDNTFESELEHLGAHAVVMRSEIPHSSRSSSYEARNVGRMVSVSRRPLTGESFFACRRARKMDVGGLAVKSDHCISASATNLGLS